MSDVFGCVRFRIPKVVYAFLGRVARYHKKTIRVLLVDDIACYIKFKSSPLAIFDRPKAELSRDMRSWLNFVAVKRGKSLDRLEPNDILTFCRIKEEKNE